MKDKRRHGGRERGEERGREDEKDGGRESGSATKKSAKRGKHTPGKDNAAKPESHALQQY